MDYQYSFAIKVPREYAFERCSNVQELSSILPANIVLRPEKGAYELSEGSVWVMKAKRSGRTFVIRNTVKTNRPPEELVFESDSNRLQSTCQIDFVADDDTNTTVNLSFEIRPKGLLGRILVQSMKASTHRIHDALEKGTGRFSKRLEQDYETLNS